MSGGVGSTDPALQMLDALPAAPSKWLWDAAQGAELGPEACVELDHVPHNVAAWLPELRL